MTKLRSWWSTDPAGLVYAATAVLAPLAGVTVFALLR